MKKYILPFMSIAMLMAMVGCSSSDDAVAEIKEESKLVPMTFTATQESNVDTRAALNGNSVDWQTNDKISVFDGTGAENNQEFTLTGDVKDGNFSGNASSTATKFTAVYPYTSGAQLESDGIVNGITLPAEQTATPDSFDPEAALMMAYTTDKSKLDFKNAVSLVKIKTEFACKKIELTADVDIAGKGTLTYDTNTDIPSFSITSETSKSITLNPASGSTEFVAGTYYIVVPPTTLTNGFSISFTASNDKVYTRKSTKSNTFNRSKIKDFGSFATTGDYWYDASRGDKVRADQEVDMGLTVNISGVNYKVIFAKTNLTATGLAENEYDYGDYFAWAATEPWCTAYTYTTSSGTATKWENTKNYNTYDWSTVPYRDGTNDQCIKYLTNGDVLDVSDDAARQILGGDWKLPTIEIWQALINTTNYKWEWTTTQDGYSGYKVTSNTDNSKSIFLPAAGFVDGTLGTLFNYVGRYGRYWSGTAHSSQKAYLLGFTNYSDFNAQSIYDRYRGLSVRPVRLVAE